MQPATVDKILLAVLIFLLAFYIVAIIVLLRFK